MKKKIICILLAFLLVFIALTLRISQYYHIACESFAEEWVKGNITKSINQTLAIKLSECDVNYDKFAKINYLSDGRIASISIDSGRINMVAVELSNNIYNCIENYKNSFGIPIGNILGYKYLSGKGRSIDITVLPIGSVDYEIKSELISGGINQTLHRVSIDFIACISCIAPFNEIKCEIKTTVILTETLIVGEIPKIMLSSLN